MTNAEAEKIVMFIALTWPRFEVSVLGGQNLTARAYAKHFSGIDGGDVMAAVMHLASKSNHPHPPSVPEIHEVVRSRAKVGQPSLPPTKTLFKHRRDEAAYYAKRGIYRREYNNPDGSRTWRWEKTEKAPAATRAYFEKIFERTKLLSKGMTEAEIDAEIKHMAKAVFKSAHSYKPEEGLDAEKINTGGETPSETESECEELRSLYSTEPDASFYDDFEGL